MISDRKSSWWVAILASAGVLSACEKEQERTPATEQEQEQDAGSVDKAAAIDPSLAKAMAVASAQRPSEQGDPQGGPPPNGVFGPGQADKELEKGTEPKLTVGSQGEAPRYPLVGSSFRPGSKVKGTIQVAVQQDLRQGALPVDFGLSFEAKAVAATSGHAAAPRTEVVAKVTSASTSVMGLPAEITAALKDLKGSRVVYQVADNGAGTNFSTIAAKGEPDQWLRALSDALAAMTLPYPEKPVGTGAFWMATSRETVLGIDTVTYRLVRVQRADPTQVTLTIETKRYAASQQVSANIAGLPPEYTLAEFQSRGEGTAMLAHGQPLPYKGLLKLGLGMLFAHPTQQDQQPLSLGVQGQARFTFEELEDPAGKPVGEPAAGGAAKPPPVAPVAPPAQTPPTNVAPTSPSPASQP